MKINLTEAILAIFILLVSIFTFKPAYDYTVVRLLIADVFVFLGALYFFERRRPFSAPLPVLISLTGFVLFVTISVACSVFPPATFRELPHFLTYILIFLVASQIYPTSFVITAWFAAAIILCFMGIIDYVDPTKQATVTPLGNKNFFAGYLILVIPITIATIWQKILALRNGLSKQSPRLSLKTGRGKPNPDYRAKHTFNDYLSLGGLILAVILFLVLLIMADSQASQAGLAVGLFFLALISFGKFVMPRLKFGLRILTLSLLIVALALTAFVGVQKGTPYVLKNVRYPLWKGSADMVVQKPITGFGPGAFLAVFQRFRPANYYNRVEVAPLSDHSHNEYLELASESGVPSAIFFLLFLTAVFVLSFRKLVKKTGDREWFLLAGLMAGLIAILVDGLFSTNLRTFSVVSVFWLLLGFCAAIISTDKNADIRLQAADFRHQTSGTKLRKNLKNSPVSNLKTTSQARPADGWPTSFVWVAIMIFGVLSAGLIGREIKGQMYYKQGIAERNAQNWPGAISQYRAALKIDPANLQAAYKLSFVYANANQTGNAINLYRDILRISPNFAKTYYNLALLSLKLNDKNSAVAYLNLGLRYDPYDAEAQKILTMLTNPPANTPVEPRAPQQNPGPGGSARPRPDGQTR